MGGVKAKVLIVEDDEFLSELISTKLDKEGFDIALAGDGETGYKKIEQFRPDIILLDIMLPGMDGFEVLEKMKTHTDETLKTTPVIILSNLGDAEDIQKAMKLGATNYFVKTQHPISEIIEEAQKYAG